MKPQFTCEQLTFPAMPAFDPFMPSSPIALQPRQALVVGSIGSAEDLQAIEHANLADSCDLVEIRLDLLDEGTRSAAPWQHFGEVPLLFTARRSSEGGAGELDAETRMQLLRESLDGASLIDIEVASIPEMQPLIDELGERALPWIASQHDFQRVPDIASLSAGLMAAQNAGAAAYKTAVELGWQTEMIAPLASFLTDCGDYPVALMGMGPLAPVSRVLFAQLGSVLNYGYLGSTPTAPGQWSAAQLREAIQSVQHA